MRLKKVIALLLILMLSMSAIVGCSSNEAPTDTKSTEEKPQESEKKILDVAAFEGGYGRAYWDAVIEQFELDHPDVEVKLTISPQIVDIIRPRLVAGDSPDYIYAGDLDKLLLKDNALEPLNDVFDSESLDGDGVKLKDKIIPGFLDYASPLDDGNIYFAPVNMSVLGMYFNQGLFDEKGWKAPKTWDDFFGFADKAKETNRALYTYQGIYPLYNQFVYGAMLVSAAGQEEADKILNYEEDAWESPKVKKVLDVFGRIASEDLLLEGTVAMNHTQAQTAFLQGQAMFLPCGTWLETEMSEAPREEGFVYGFIPAPKLDAGDDTYVMSSFEKHYIPKNAKNKELAKEFMKYQYKTENMILKAKLSKAVMPVVDGVELVKEHITPGMYNAFSVFSKYDAKPLNFQWKVVAGAEANVEKAFSDAINSVMNKTIDVDEWLAKTKKENENMRRALENQ